MKTKSNTRGTGKCWLALCSVLVVLEGAAATHNVNTVTALTNAIAKASSGDTIMLAAGRYDLSTLTEYKNGTSWGTMSSPDSNAGTSCIWFGKSLTLRGADTTSWREKTAAQETILDGGGVGTIVYIYGGTGRSSNFQHLTFTNGVAVSGKNGGGIYALGPTGGIITNCVFRNCSAVSGGGSYCLPAFDTCYENCSASNHGGGAYGDGAYAYKTATNRFVNCVFNRCSANGAGGGIYHNQSSVLEGKNIGVVDGCVFSNCTAATGGAVNERVGGLVRRCVFVGNVATNTGGAANNCTRIENCAFTNNVALCQDGEGGGALKSSTAVSCVFVENASHKYGGATYGGSASNCVFEANASTNQGGACAWTGARDCVFLRNRSTGNRGGAFCNGSADHCAFTNNYCSKDARGGACAYTRASDCLFSGIGDVSCGSYERCVFDGVVSAQSPNQQKWVFDCLWHSGGSIYVTNCLVVNCNVDRIVNVEGRLGEFVNCTFANNTVGNNGATLLCNRGRDYNDNKHHPGTNIVVNCLFSGNRFANGNDADMSMQVHVEETDFGFCSIQLVNCLYTDGATNLDSPRVTATGIVRGNPRFVAGHAKYPEEPYYALLYGSAARNMGVNAAWMAGATDMAGRGRLYDGTVDIGCYECYLPDNGTLLIFR